MAWTYNDTEVTSYMTQLKAITYSDSGSIKTGIDNYKIILNEAKDLSKKRKKEKQFLLNTLSTQLTKYIYIIDKLETDLDDNNVNDNYLIFQNNIKQLVEVSKDMNEINNKVFSAVAVEFEKLRKYKRLVKELTARYLFLTNAIKFYEESEELYKEVESKLDSI